MFEWFNKAEKTLEDVLGHFNKVHDDLNVFIDKTSDKVDELQNKLNASKSDLDTARAVLENVKNILNKQ